ncbi:hypothetical protein TNCV_3972221 [Trichonephila clavipes]|nr:hypothetical protein TNCV_3972221 [Trichonephila clavipes]
MKFVLPQKSVEDALVRLCDIIKEGKRKNHVTFLISLDIKGAFDNVPGGLASCTFSKVSKFLKISFALLGASYNVVQLILHWVTSQRILFWKKAAHKGQ